LKQTTRLIGGLAIALGLGAVGATVAAQTASTPLVIESAVPDEATGTLTISGSGFGARPFVTLDLVPLNLQLSLPQRVVATVPVEMIPPGSYLLTVTRGGQPGDTASTDVRIGPAPAGSTAPSTAPGSAASGAPSPSTARSQASQPSSTDAAARVGDRTITIADLDKEWQRVDPIGYLAASRQLYDARRRVLTDLVNNELLSREAASRGMTVDALLAAELPKRTIALPDNAVTSLYQSLGSRTRGASLVQLRPALREWLARKVEPDLAKMSYVEELTKVSTRADVLLSAPAVTVEHAADDPAIGPESAPVELVIFGDFQNPTYARYALTIPRVRDLFGARLRFVFKHFPANDPASIAAAEAAACANLQGKFWEFHNTLLGAAGTLDSARFKKVAEEIGLDRATFDPCIDREQTRDRIGAALEETRRYELPGTPSLLVNGRLAPDPPAFLPPFEYFKRLVEEELARQAREPR
jgi:protein-disulfide isomerase